MNANAPGSDPVYKRLYALPEMVADLLRSLLPGGLGIDEGSLRKLSAEYVGDDFRARRGDTVWRLDAADAAGRVGKLHVLVLLEFQSKDDATMALRVLEYTAMLYRELARAGSTGPDGLLPPVLPVVLYNGDAPWRSASQVRDLVTATGPVLSPFQPSQRHLVLDERHAPADDPALGDLTRAVLLLEQSRSLEGLAQAAAFLAERLGAPERGARAELARAFADWLAALVRRLEGGAGANAAGARPGGKLSFEEVRMTLEERVAEWPKPYIRQGREEGRKKGRKEGREEGREEGIARERMLLLRQAAARFGATTADRLAGALAAEADPERLADIGEAIVRCATGDELLREAGVRT